MSDSGIKICDVQQIVEHVKQSCLSSVSAASVSSQFPEYLPPVILTDIAERGILQACELVCRMADCRAAVLFSAHYADSRRAEGCCLVLNCHLRQEGWLESGRFESGVKEELRDLGEGLRRFSIALNTDTGEGGIDLEICIPIYSSKPKAGMQRRDTIVVIEDNPQVRHSTRDVLEHAGYRVRECCDAEDGLMLFDDIQNQVALVIADVTLPGRSGKELADIIHAIVPQLPVLLTSGYSQSIPENPGRGLYFLPKPYNFRLLTSAVQRCLQDHLKPHVLPRSDSEGSRFRSAKG